MKIIIPLALLTLLPFLSFADGGISISGGGHCAIVDSKPYLLDLVEHDLHQNPFFGSSPEFVIHEEVLDGMANLLPDLDLDLLRRKVSDIGGRDPVLGMTVLKTIEGLDWDLTDITLKQLEPDTILQVPIFQCAVRTGNHILIKKDLWERLDQANRVALIIHEAIAALAARDVLAAPPPRNLTASLFDVKFYLKHVSEIQKDLVFFPSWTALENTVGLWGNSLVSMREIGEFTRPHGKPYPQKGEVLVEEYLFLPVLKSRWMNRESGEILEKQIQLKADTIISDSKTFLQACQKGESELQLVSLEVGYHSIEAVMDEQLSDGYPLPRFIWKTKYQERSTINFLKEPNSKVANCSADNRQQLVYFGRWLSRFQKYN